MDGDTTKHARSRFALHLKPIGLELAPYGPNRWRGEIPAGDYGLAIVVMLETNPDPDCEEARIGFSACGAIDIVGPYCGGGIDYAWYAAVLACQHWSPRIYARVHQAQRDEYARRMNAFTKYENATSECPI